MLNGFVLIAYVGPETILPVTSALAAVGGAFLMFGRYLRTGFAWCVRTAKGKQPGCSETAGLLNEADDAPRPASTQGERQ